MSRVIRVVAAVVCGVAAASLLSGCNRNFEILGPYSLSFDGEHLLIGICTDMTIDEVKLSQSIRSRRPFEDSVVWEAAGSFSARHADALTVGGSNPGLFNSTVEAPEPIGRTRYRVRFNDGSDAAQYAVWTIPEEGLESGMWLTPLGEIRDQPCAPAGETPY